MNEYERYGDYREQKIQPAVRSDTGNAVKFLVIGMGIGAAVALLLTPMSGNELRNAIGQGCRNAFDGLTEQTRNLRDRGSNLLGFTRRKVAGAE